MVEVQLTEEEIAEANRIAYQRQKQNLEKGREDRYGADPDEGMTLHRRGAQGEKAVSKWLGVEWDGNIGNLEAADVGVLEVRTTEYQDGALILHPEDNDDSIFILVTEEYPIYRIRGWIRGSSGKSNEFWEDRSGGGRHAYFVPQNRLNDPDVLNN